MPVHYIQHMIQIFKQIILVNLFLIMTLFEPNFIAMKLYNNILEAWLNRRFDLIHENFRAKCYL